MRLLNAACLPTLFLAAAAPIAGLAQSGVALTVAPYYTSRSAEFQARWRSPAVALSAPALAALTSNVVGPALHLHLGFATSEPYTGAYGVSLDAPIRGTVHSGQTRVGLSLAALEGLCQNGMLDLEGPCILGYSYGLNVIASLPQVGKPRAPGSPTLTVGLSLDLGVALLTYPYSDGTLDAAEYRERTTSAGFGLPIMVSFRAGRRTSATEKDPRFNPRTTIFVEPGISMNHMSTDSQGGGAMTQMSAGASILEIGPGFGITAVVRKLLIGSQPYFGALAVSYHGRRNRL